MSLPRALLVSALVALAVLHRHDAAACGGFFAVSSIEASRRPSLAYEQVLLIHDAKAGREHFVREVTFDGGDASFGFVVPTPTRPEVAKVAKSPFPALRTAFPFRAPEAATGGGFGGGARAGVEVLEVSKVGSFTAFVLRAEEPGALASWLAKNKLVSTPEADRWLAHYVKQKFFYVAMRYDGGKPGGPSALTSETIRISFDTPVPFYPYFEPERPKTAAPLPARLLDLWVVASEPLVPVSLRRTGDTHEWVRPMRAGHETRHPFPKPILDPSLAVLVPEGTLSVQTFTDQKVSRSGYGDVLFVPREAVAPGQRADRLAQLAPFLSILETSEAP